MKRLHMIGFSHIDLVWFWDKTEGFQEARATFASVLDRIQEYPDFIFTCTSPALLDFIERLDPPLFARIREQVLAGRIELTGGFWVEPDCNLPHGESMVRQGLYGQEYYLRAFGRRATIGGNVDSFGHGPMLPQILSGCGMDAYYFMRPRLSRQPDAEAEKTKPVVSWQSPDGSAVTALCLPGEYTCWFEETLRDNIKTSLAQLDPYPSLPCFYGVGNHGGGPTIKNIEAVHALRAEFPETDLMFSTLSAFFDEVKPLSHPVLTSYLEHVNTGCYSIDHHYKQALRKAEQALLRAERLNAMAALAGCEQVETAKTYAPLWKRLLVCQFHDTLGGTSIRPARDNALRDMHGVTAQAEDLIQEALTKISQRINTQGEGTPILLFNDTGHPFRGVVDLELNWFCKDPLTITDHAGHELACQQAENSCTMRWYRLGGRRTVLFETELPPFGYALLRAHAKQPQVAHAPGIPDTNSLRLENEHILAEFDEVGNMVRLVDKATGYQALGAPVQFEVWHDQRDSWGHHSEGRLYENSGEKFTTDEARLVTQGPLRSTIRVRQSCATARLEILYSLDKGAKAVMMRVRVLWDGPWKSLKLRMPVSRPITRSVSEAAYALMERQPSRREYYMHRFVDAQTDAGSGLAVANDSTYSFSITEDSLLFTLLRSAIFAHGDCIGWENEFDTYEYNDLGEHEYRFALLPHGENLPKGQLMDMADRLSSPPLHFTDTNHPGAGQQNLQTNYLSMNNPSVRLGAIKPAQDNQGFILRLFDGSGAGCEAQLAVGGAEKVLAFKPQEIKTLRLQNGQLRFENMLEDTL